MGSISGPTICSLAFWGLVFGAAAWSAKRASQRSFFSPPFALSFGAQYLVSMAAAATILCVQDRLHHQRVYLLKVSLRNHNHVRSTQLLRLQAYKHTQWGPTATKPEMLVFEAPKTGLLKVLLRTQNHMLSTQLLRLQASTHIERVHGCKAWFLAKEASFFGPVAFNVGATPRDIQGNIILAQCLDHDWIQTKILGGSLTWKPALRFGAWIFGGGGKAWK